MERRLSYVFDPRELQTGTVVCVLELAELEDIGKVERRSYTAHQVSGRSCVVNVTRIRTEFQLTKLTVSVFDWVSSRPVF